MWIGGQFPVDSFLSYGHILTLHNYLVLAFVSLTFSSFHCGFVRATLLCSVGESERRRASHSLIFMSFMLLTLLI